MLRFDELFLRMSSESTLIIGAGPAGLAIAGQLHHLELPYQIVEQASTVAPAWYRHYDRLHLHTVKKLSHLPHKPFAESLPQYIPREDLVAYFEAYAKEKEINPDFGVTISSVKKEGQNWVATSTGGQVYPAKQVVICTGFNRKPHEPQWKGMERFKGKIVHSRFYKTGKAYAGQKVLVVGMGNTGAEVALDLFECGAKASLSVRGPINIVRRDTFGRPVQETAILLSKFPHVVGDTLGKLTSILTVGDLSPHGIERPDVAPARQLRETGKTPVIDVGTVDRIKAGDIRVFPTINSFGEEDILFDNGQREAFDAIILATGYRPALSEFLDSEEGIFDGNGYPANWKVEAQPGLYLLGYDVYTPGGLLLSIRRDSERIATDIASQS